MTNTDLTTRPWARHYPSQVPIRLNYPNQTLPQLLDQTAQQFPDTLATIFFGQQMTYSALAFAVSRFATALSKLGVKKGDRVMLMAPNCPQFVIAYYSILKLGAIVVQTNPMYVEREILYQANDSGAKVVIFYDALYPRIKNARAEACWETLITFSFAERMPVDDSVLRLEELAANTGGGVPPVSIDLENDVAVFQYTGGTTGVSKGVMLTHKNLVANAWQVRHWFHDAVPGQERVLSVLPFFHSFGMTCSMNLPVVMGLTMILVPRFNPDEVLEVIKAHQPTIFPGVPTMFTAIVNHPRVEEYNVACIRDTISGGAPCPVELVAEFKRKIGAPLLEGYGLSETSPVTHCNPLGGMTKVGSIGLPISDTDCKIVDLETGTRELGENQVGELIIKGPQVMKGYWNMPEDTAATLRDGWLYTGDIAKMDEDGYFYIVDRKKEMIIAGGYNIYPRDVEEVLYEHPKVMQAAVVGVPDKYRGETVKAFVVLRPGETMSEQEVIEYCRQKMAAYKVPRLVEFRDSLPMSAVGKILRRELAAEERKRAGL